MGMTFYSQHFFEETAKLLIADQNLSITPGVTHKHYKYVYPAFVSSSRIPLPYLYILLFFYSWWYLIDSWALFATI